VQFPRIVAAFAEQPSGPCAVVLGVELIKIAGGGSELLRIATDLARERGGYFVHPHLDPLWTDGYQSIAAEVLRDLPTCRSIVFPVGGGGLLMGLLA